MVTVDLKKGKVKAALGIFLFLTFSFFLLSEPSSTSSSTYDTPDTYHAFFHNILNGTEVSWTLVNTFSNVTEMNLEYSNGFTSAGDNIEIIIDEEGRYLIDLDISFSGGANTRYETIMSRNGLEVNTTESYRKIGTGGDVGSASGSGVIPLDQYDRVGVYMRNLDNTKSAFIEHLGLTLVRIGDI